MKYTALRRFIFLFGLIFAVFCPVAAQEKLVQFHPVGEPTLCKGCGHAGRDYWKLTIRLKNVSGSDLVLYGDKIGDEFDALNYFQRRNTNTCKWEYGFGETTRRVAWSEMRPDEKVPRLFKANEVIDSVAGFDRFDNDMTLRLTAFVAKSSAVEPTEIFSEPYKPKVSIDSDSASYSVVNDSCSPLCTIGLTESPKISGIQLGMSVNEFSRLYPKIKIHTLYKRPDTFKTAYIWAWDSDAYSINVTFINDSVGRIEPKFRSLDKARDRDDFWQRISSTIGMPKFWKPFMSEWKCLDFVVEVVTNENPDIFIQTPEYMRVRDRINNEELKRRR